MSRIVLPWWTTWKVLSSKISMAKSCVTCLSLEIIASHCWILVMTYCVKLVLILLTWEIATSPVLITELNWFLVGIHHSFTASLWHLTLVVDSRVVAILILHGSVLHLHLLLLIVIVLCSVIDDHSVASETCVRCANHVMLRLWSSEILSWIHVSSHW